jgi:hypothetical protein
MKGVGLPGNDSNQRRQIALATLPKSLNRPLHRLVRLRLYMQRLLLPELHINTRHTIPLSHNNSLGSALLFSYQAVPSVRSISDF